MALNQTLILLLLFGLTATSTSTPGCIFHEDGPRCVCNIMGILNTQNLICLQVLELELRDDKLDNSLLDFTSFPHDAFQLFQIKINRLVFNNVTISFSFISAVFPFLSPILEEITVISSTLQGAQHFHPQLAEASKIKSLQLVDTRVDPSLLQPSFDAFHHWLFGSLESFSLVRSGLVKIDCSWAQRAENLSCLDLSENPISFTGLQNISHCSSLSFKSLKSLHLRHSNLTSLQPLCTPLSLTPALTQLDVSRNNFSIFYFPLCLQKKPLRTLNLSHSGITEIDSLLSESLEELDLSHNSLEVFNNPLQALKKLDLSHNHLIRLPSLDHQPNLKTLNVDSNRLTILIKESGVNMRALEQLDSLHAGRNPYQCDCALKETIVFLNTGRVLVEDYPEEFLCATPVAQQGTRIMNLFFEACVKPTSGTQHRGFPLCLALFVGLLSYMIYFC